MADDAPSKFSMGITLSDLNDYITPSQACIKPVKIDSKDANKITSIEVDSQSNAYYQVNIDGTRTQLQKTKIELSDCLACSGCITSAETILVNQQSVQEFIDKLSKCNILPSARNPNEPQKAILIMSISPQSRASLAAYFKLGSAKSAMIKLNALCKQVLGAEFVFDTSYGRYVSLLEMCEEFVERYKKEHGENYKENLVSPQSNLSNPPEKKRKLIKNTNLPLLASACPGWICYAEKTQGQETIPFISTVKSPQAIMGSLVKRHFADQFLQKRQQAAVSPIEIYHVTVMPCYDKKLEAAREDFVLPSDANVREVDMVLTTTELKELIEKYAPNGDLSTLGADASIAVDPLFNDIICENNDFEIGGIKGGSGGYMETVFKYAAKHLYGVKVDEITYKKGRNEDFKECSLELEGKKVLTFAICNGFRNIQNIVRKLKQKSCEYDFVEVMACPSGCLNGGGQVKAPNKASAKEFLKSVDEIYHNVTLSDVNSEKFALGVKATVYEQWLKCEPNSGKAKEVLHTSYHAREKLNINPLALNW